MVNRVEQMTKVQTEALELFKKKNTDYGDAFAEYGVIGVLMRIEDKLKRSVSITKNGVNLVKDEKIRDKSVLDFGIIFVSNNTSQNNYSLCEILGFDKNEYLNNNMYIGEKSPIENIYQNIYFKLFINDIEIERYYTTKETFTYYDKINFNLQSNYGNKICHIPNLNTPYDIDEELEYDDENDGDN